MYEILKEVDPISGMKCLANVGLLTEDLITDLTKSIGYQSSTESLSKIDVPISSSGPLFMPGIEDEIKEKIKSGNITPEYAQDIRESLNYLCLNENGDIDPNLITPEMTKIFGLLKSLEPKDNLETKMLFHGSFGTPVCSYDDNFKIADYMVVCCTNNNIKGDTNYTLGIGLNILPTGHAHFHGKDLVGKKIISRHFVSAGERYNPCEGKLKRSLLIRMGQQFKKSKRTRGGSYLILGRPEINTPLELEYCPNKKSQGEVITVSVNSKTDFATSLRNIYGHILTDFGRRI